MAICVVTEENFTREVFESKIPVLIDFWADWCGPCRMLAPVLEELAGEYADRIKVAKVNVDDEPELASLFRIDRIPTVVAVRNGRTVDVLTGVRTKEELVGAFSAERRSAGS